MRNKINLKRIALSVLAVICVLSAESQEFPKMDKSPMDIAYYPPRVAFRVFAKTDEGKNAKPIIRVLYSRPQKNDRVIFGDLIKYGEVWRIGANESTEILFMQDVTIDGQTVSAGRYTMYAMVNEDAWTIMFSSDLDGWGNYGFKPEESTIAKITVPTQKTTATVEAMSILFEEGESGANMIIGWDGTMVSVPIGL